MSFLIKKMPGHGSVDATIIIKSKRRLAERIEVVVDFVINEGPHLPPRSIEKVFSLRTTENLSESDVDSWARCQAIAFLEEEFPTKD